MKNFNRILSVSALSLFAVIGTASAALVTDGYVTDYVNATVGTATQNALDGKMASDAVIPQSQIENLGMALDNKLDTTGTIEQSQVNGLTNALAGKQAAGDYATNTALTDGLNAKQDLLTTEDFTGSGATVTVGADGKINVAVEGFDDTGLTARLDAIEADYTTSTELNDKVETLDKEDAAVAGEYVSAVSEADGIITVTRAALPTVDQTYSATSTNAQSGVAVAGAIAAIPAAGAGELDIQVNNTSVGTFSANATEGKAINIAVPTTVAQLTDAGNYATDQELTDGLAEKVSTAGNAASSAVITDESGNITTGKINTGMLAGFANPPIECAVDGYQCVLTTDGTNLSWEVIMRSVPTTQQ